MHWLVHGGEEAYERSGVRLLPWKGPPAAARPYWINPCRTAYSVSSLLLFRPSFPSTRVR